MGLSEAMRRHAAGHYIHVMPRHKPDPFDPSKDWVDPTWNPPQMSDAEIMAQGGGQSGGLGGGQAYNLTPPGPVSGEQPGVDPGPGWRPDPLEAIRQHAQSLPGWQQRHQQMMAGDPGMRQQLAGSDQAYQTAMAQQPPQQTASLADVLKLLFSAQGQR